MKGVKGKKLLLSLSTNLLPQSLTPNFFMIVFEIKGRKFISIRVYKPGFILIDVIKYL